MVPTTCGKDTHVIFYLVIHVPFLPTTCVWRRKDVDLNLVALGNHQTASHSVWFAFSAQSVTRTLKEVPPPLSFDPLTPLPLLKDNSAGQR